MACATNVLSYLTTLPSVTHLFIIEHVLYTFELIPRPLAQQLVSLRFGPLSSDYYHNWEPHGSIELNTVDFLYDFPRLRYVEQHMRQVRPAPFYISLHHFVADNIPGITVYGDRAG